MNFNLTKEQEMIQKSAVDFATKFLKPIAYDTDRTAEYPAKEIAAMAEQDYLGVAIPEEFGGMAADSLSIALMIEAFGRANGAAATIVASHTVTAAGTIAKYGSEELKKNYLPAMAKGEKIGGYAFAEPGAALASGEDKVVAKKDDGEYLLNGKKTFVYNGDVADVYIVIAQVNEEAEQKGVAVFLVDADNVKVLRKVDKLGLRAFPTAELEFKDSKGMLIGTEEKGVEIMKNIQARTDVAFAAMALGVSQAALDESKEHAKTRVQFGSPIGRLQAVQWMLADIATNIHMMKLAIYRAAIAIDEDDNYINQVALMKQYVAKAGPEIGMEAVQIHGGIGYCRESNIERYFRDIRGAYNFENANEYPQRIIAASLLN
ncbi:MAG TPA: acyl-CoA dehydrogenase family protein [Anaerovoracaceae bacterium]|nr:acyl-CoA dehydrogenase family protein [Anaerovoracaceae bacterium]